MDVSQNLLRSTRHRLDEGSRLLTQFLSQGGLIDKALHQSAEIIGISYLQATATLLQSLSLLEALVVRTEEYGNISDGSLQRVMDSYAKATTNISYICIVIDA